ncbi:hypothetical protein AB0953_17470 [Streptomyces sp. NPDC046866]|uniref:hypothetical protein n=1 Tax=Streptomyces sp. NPDC046866 TaxID=3154921 RepID=UPI003452E15B
MPLSEEEWVLVTEWVRDKLLDSPDPYDRLEAAGYPPDFIGELGLTNKSAVNAANLVRAARRNIHSQSFLIGVLLCLDELTVEGNFEQQLKGFQARLEEDKRVDTLTEDHFLACVLRNGSDVFIDRAGLRERLKELEADPDKIALVVDGEPGSGRSYSYHLIRYLGQHLGIRPLHVKLSRTTTASLLIQQLAARIDRGGYLPLNPTQLNDPLWAVDQAVQLVVARATAVPERFWIVLDDCDALDANSDVWDCIDQLAQAVYDYAPGPGETPPQLVLLGYGPTMPQLPSDVRDHVLHDTAHVVGPEELRAFFREFFTHAPVQQDADTIAARIGLAAEAVLAAANTPGPEGYMSRLRRAAETAVRTFGALEPGEDFAVRLHEELRTAAAPQPAPPVPEARRAYREAACLLSRFDPAGLKLPGEEKAAGGALAALVHDCITLGLPPDPLWALKDDVRREALGALAGPDAARRALEANLDQFPEGPGPERIVLDHLRGRPPTALEELDADALTATLQAALWLSQIPGAAGFPSPEDVQQQLDRARLLQPLRRLVQGTFCGRTAALADLRSYVLGTDAPLRRPPLVVHGVGGIGKTTLLAKFLLDSIDVPRGTPPPFAFAYVDFDRPTLSVHEPVTLIAEMARQLGTQYPAHRAAFDALASECEETARTQWDEQKALGDRQGLSGTSLQDGRTAAERFQASARESESRLVSRVAQLLVDAAGPAGGDGPTLVVAVDSFETAQYRGSIAIGRFWSLWRALQEACPRLRFVIAGRAPIDHPARMVELRTIRLDDLEPEAAVELLGANGVQDTALARTLAERVGGHPLSLKLAARAAVALAEEAGSLGELVESLRVRHRDLDRTVDRTLVQGTLYDRFLRHIPDDTVRTLAQAGLALRTLTPGVVKDVLAEPCGLRVDSEAEARRLFDRLARLDLTEPVGPEAVRHCCDLRSVMLPLSDTARPGLMRDVARRAVQYYEGRPGVDDRAEEIYHRLRLNENPRTVEQRWQDGVERHLGDAAADMAPRSAAFLVGRLGGHISAQALRGADPEDWQRIIAHEVEDLLAQGYIDEAAARLAEPPPWSPGSRLHVLCVTTLWRSGRRAEARVRAREAVDRAREAGEAGARLELLVLAADLAEDAGDLAEAETDLAEAEDTATGLGRPFDAVEVRLRRARLAPEGEARSQLDDGLAAMLGRLSDEALRERPELVRHAAAEAARRDPAALDRVLQAVGLPEAADAVADVLAAAMDRAAQQQPELRPALEQILAETAGRVPLPAAQAAAQAAGPAAPLRAAGLLQEVRAPESLLALARRLLVLRDPGGTLVAGVAAAADPDAPARGLPGRAPHPHWRTPERNGPQAA